MQLVREIHRRSLWQVLSIYVVGSWVALQLVDVLTDNFGLPDWFPAFALGLLIVGLPIVLATAFVQEGGPGQEREGQSRSEPEAGFTKAGENGDEGGRPGAGVLTWQNAIVGGVLAFALWGVVAAGWILFRDDEAGGSPVEDRSIAVLPFIELGEAEPGVFTEGLHDDLLTRLSNISGLTVISRTAVQRYRDAEMTTREIATELGVRWVMEGGVQEMGEEIQVNAQLIDPRTESHVWAESYRRELSARSLFELQTEITKRIARALETRLTTAEKARVERVPTENLAAYRLYVQGRTLMDTRTERGMRQAVDYFRRAIQEDSTYALAWSGLADVRGLLGVYGHEPRDSMVPEVRVAAERALELEPDLAEAHTSMGLAYDMSGKQLRALEAYRRAVELKPSYARANYWLGIQWLGLGRLEEAEAPLKRAVELDPMSPVYHLGLVSWYQFRDRLAMALEEARKHDEFGDQPAGPSKPGEVLSLMSRHDEALSSLRSAVERTDAGSLANLWARGRLAAAQARAGHRERARELLAAFAPDQRGQTGVPLVIARAYAAVGQSDSAFAYLPSLGPGALLYDPAWDPLRDDPRWDELVREARLRWGLNPDGSIPDSVDVGGG